MLRICRIYVESYRLQVQFSFHSCNLNSTNLHFLGQDNKNKDFKAWHGSWKCSRIKHYQYPHPKVLHTCSAYDDVKLSAINDLAKEASQQYITSSIFQQLRAQTEAHYNAVLYNWKSHKKPCKFSNTERTCEGQALYVFERNGVNIYQVYVLHILTLCRRQ